MRIFLIIFFLAALFHEKAVDGRDIILHDDYEKIMFAQNGKLIKQDPDSAQLLNDLHNEVLELKKQLEKLNEKNQSLQKEIGHLQAMELQYETELENTKTEMQSANMNIQNLKSRIEELLAEKDILEDHIVQLNGHIQKKSNEEKERIIELQIENERCKQEIQELRQIIAELQQELQLIREE